MKTHLQPTGLRRREWLCLPAATLLLPGCAAPTLPDFADLVARTSPAVVGIADERGVIGSGFRLLGTRRFVTAAHLVSAPRGRLAVAWQDQRWPVSLLRSDVEADLALLEAAEDLPMPGLALRTGEAPAQGAWIVVLGRPFGGKTTATFGIVSAEPGAVKEPAVLRSRLQLNAAINPGNSGGPVVDLAGRVVGVVSATLPGGAGLGFAAPAAALAALLQGAPG